MQQYPADAAAKKTMFHFLRQESAGGIVMMVAAMCALVLANSPVAMWYEQIVYWPLGSDAFGYHATAPLHAWVNDGAMVLFFLVIGMELKRELSEGILADKRQVRLPLIAAAGGMFVPALVFLLMNQGIAEHHAGWAIPTATDIAFALAVLMIAAKKVPAALKIFLLAIAIFDDIGAILIIAFFYSGTLAALPLLIALNCTLFLTLLHQKHVAALWPYLLIGGVLCLMLHEGGIHTTIGGVVTGLLVPMRTGKGGSPLNRLMQELHPWVTFAILPLFALVTAGIPLGSTHASTLFSSPLSQGIILGLVLGKPLGILGAGYAAVKVGLATLPPHTSWQHLQAVSVIAGIGFTMSLFINSLAFEHDATLLAHAKLAIIAASVVSALTGVVLLKWNKVR